MNPFLGNLPFSPDDYELKSDDEVDPYERLDLSEWSTEVDGEIDKLMQQSQEEDYTAFLDDDDDDDENKNFVSAGGGGVNGGLKDRLVQTNKPNQDEDEEPPVKDDFADDEDGWQWR